MPPKLLRLGTYIRTRAAHRIPQIVQDKARTGTTTKLDKRIERNDEKAKELQTESKRRKDKKTMTKEEFNEQLQRLANEDERIRDEISGLESRFQRGEEEQPERGPQLPPTPRPEPTPRRLLYTKEREALRDKHLAQETSQWVAWYQDRTTKQWYLYTANVDDVSQDPMKNKKEVEYNERKIQRRLSQTMQFYSNIQDDDPDELRVTAQVRLEVPDQIGTIPLFDIVRIEDLKEDEKEALISKENPTKRLAPRPHDTPANVEDDEPSPDEELPNQSPPGSPVPPPELEEEPPMVSPKSEDGEVEEI